MSLASGERKVYECEISGSKVIVTDRRVVVYEKGLLSEKLRDISLDHISSIEVHWSKKYLVLTIILFILAFYLVYLPAAATIVFLVAIVFALMHIFLSYELVIHYTGGKIVLRDGFKRLSKLQKAIREQVKLVKQV